MSKSGVLQQRYVMFSDLFSTLSHHRCQKGDNPIGKKSDFWYPPPCFHKMFPRRSHYWPKILQWKIMATLFLFLQCPLVPTLGPPWGTVWSCGTPLACGRPSPAWGPPGWAPDRPCGPCPPSGRPGPPSGAEGRPRRGGPQGGGSLELETRKYMLKMQVWEIWVNLRENIVNRFGSSSERYFGYSAHEKLSETTYVANVPPPP